MSLNFSENVEGIFEKLEKFFTSKTVVGEVIEIGDVKILPIMDITFGLSSGAATGKDKNGDEGSGSGGGLGATAQPKALVIIKGDKIEVVQIGKKAGIEKIMEMVPDLVEKIKSQE